MGAAEAPPIRVPTKEQPTVTSEQLGMPPSAPTPLAFPDDYTGVRDTNMVALFSSIKTTIDHQARLLADDNLSSVEVALAEDRFVRYSAYLALIQQQRHFYYGYETPSQRRWIRPANTDDVLYHTTGMERMSVVFELRRSDFPEVFEKMGALRTQLGEQSQSQPKTRRTEAR